jgi:putative membrane-bound dehydrogenase-like protein
MASRRLIGVWAALLAMAAPPTLLAAPEAPDGFALTEFAGQPEVYAPACLTTTPSGVVYVGIDAAGSLGKQTGDGKIVRCVDTDGDGKADQFTEYATPEHPRGLVFDGEKLYVLHPPKLSVYEDTDGDGKADQNRVLVSGISTEMNEKRGADHTTNGINMGIDGWIYIVVGDFGFVKAEGTDGSTRQFKGGGIARVRPDGSHLQIFARGLRNPYDVAISPRLNLFTRGNTNDGDGWDVRLQHIMALGHHGYPSLYMNFNDEIVPPLTEYGGGSGTGALYVHEPGLPDTLSDTLLTADWGRNKVYRHQLKREGVSFAEKAQKSWMDLTRPTQLDTDARGRVYVASWGPVKFNPSDRHVGAVYRLRHAASEPIDVPDPAEASDRALVKQLAARSATLRRAVQRELLRRDLDGEVVDRIEQLAESDAPVYARIAALYTLKQRQGANANPFLVKLARQHADVRAFALRALAGQPDQLDNVPSEVFIEALDDPRPRVRREAIIGLGRLKRKNTARALVAKLGSDRLTRHLAVKALARIGAVKPLLTALDETSGRTYEGVLWALKLMHKPAVVDGLIEQLRETSNTARRKPILIALMRLHYKESPHTGGWWGTRPDTHGPYYDPEPWAQTDRIAKVLKRQLVNSASLSAWLQKQLARHQIEIERSIDEWLKLARRNEAGRKLAVNALAQRDDVPRRAMKFFSAVARDAQAAPAVRVQAFEALRAHSDDKLAKRVVRAAGALLQAGEAGQDALTQAVRDYTGQQSLANRLARIKALTDARDAATRQVGFAAMAQLAGHEKVNAAKREQIRQWLDDAWQNDQQRAALLRAIGAVRAEAFADRIRKRIEASGGELDAALTYAANRLGVDLSSQAGQAGGEATPIAGLDYNQMLDRVKATKGDAAVGARVFKRTGCINCHTVSPEQTPKGPDLTDIAARYSQNELIESIAKPNASIAQGFATVQFTLEDGSQKVGFVVEEGSDSVVIRNIAGVSSTLEKDRIKARKELDRSLMPPGLANTMTVKEFASLLTYLEKIEQQNAQADKQ